MSEAPWGWWRRACCLKELKHGRRIQQKKRESDYESEFCYDGKGTQQNQRNCLLSGSKMYPKRVEMMCLSDMIFKSFVLHMASSLNTAITLCLL